MEDHIVNKESDLYPIIKKYFKDQGYTVFAEVACGARGVDLVAINDKEEIAVELKTSFNSDVVWQSYQNRHYFDKVYIAFPVKEARFFHQTEYFFKQRETIQNRYNNVINNGIGMLQVLPSGFVYEENEAKQQNPMMKIDLQFYVESDEDLGGVPYQRGVSQGYHELLGIKKYVTANPRATWKEIYDNVPNHYSSPASMSGSMSQWRGFYLSEFKKTLV